MGEPLGQWFYSALNNVEQCRRQFAELINAKGSEVAFTTNTSSAISTIALSVPLKEGDRILVPENEFPSNYYPWINLKNKGIQCEKFRINKNIPLVETLKNLDLKGVKLISLSAVSYETGRFHEIKQFAEFCKDHGILSCVDAIQAVGAVPVDVKDWNIDFLCSGAQKWLMGPVGCGLIYCKESLLENLNVPFVGWTSVVYPETMDLGDLDFSKEMTRFEPGLPHYLAISGVKSSLSQLHELGWQSIFESIKSNTQYLQSGLKDLGLELLTGENDFTAGITSFYVPKDFNRRTIETAYNDEQVKITARNNYLRVSPHFFNTKKELDLFLNKTQKIFKRTTQIKPLVSDFSLKKEEIVELIPETNSRVLITGATGNLGRQMVRLLLKKGLELHLVDCDKVKLDKLLVELKQDNLLPNSDSKIATYDVIDFRDVLNFKKWLTQLEASHAKSFSALINCAGAVEPSLFEDLKEEHIDEMINVNFTAPLSLARSFVSKLKSNDALGVLNFVSSTGRCGSPLLSVYAASNGALWSLGESLSREYADKKLRFTTFVAPAMHSPMQKRMGRISLRFFKIYGEFNYEVAENIAQEAFHAFFISKKTTHLSKLSRLKIFINAIFPDWIDKKVKGVWRK